MNTSTMPENMVYGTVDKVNIVSCPYCKKDYTRTDLCLNDELRISLLNDSMMIVLEKTPWEYTTVDINYCPMCGRKLGDINER